MTKTRWRWTAAFALLMMLPAFALAQWTETTIIANNTVFDDVRGMNAGDIDGDGDTDILAVSYSGASLSWFENPAGDGSVYTEHEITNTGANFFEEVAAVDIDGDTDLDIVVRREGGSNHIYIYKNTAGDGSAWTEGVFVTNTNNCKSMYPVDLDGDGDMDIVYGITNFEGLSWLENQSGDGSNMVEQFISAEVQNYEDIDVGDIDGDGDPDIMVVTSTVDDIIWYENTAGDASAWTSHTIFTNYEIPVTLSLADIDGDSDLDFVTGHQQNVTGMDWVENTAGDGSAWTTHSINNTISTVTFVYTADIDSDGDMDVVSSEAGVEFAWWDNTAGDGSSWTKETISTTLVSPQYINLADANDDGLIDVVGWDQTNDKAVWLENENTPQTEPDYITLSGTVSNSSAISEGTKAGLFSGTTDGYDVGYDIPKPAPPASDYLDVYFPHSGWAGDVFGDRWAVDVRDADADLVTGVHIYEITSATDQLGEDVTLTFTLDGDYPAEHPVILHDTSDDSYQDLRANNAYTYTDAGSRTLNLRVGDLTDPDIAFTSPVDGDDLIATSTHTITFTYSDISAAASHVLEYSVDGQATWTAITTLADGDLDHDWTVPNVFTTDARLRLTSLDVAGNDSTIVSGGFTIAPDTYSTDIATGYNMISPPLIAADPSNDAVFGDDLTGTYFVWEWDPATDYVLTDTTTLGEGYWLASDAAVTVDIDGSAELDSTTTALATGWNMVGSGMIPQIAKADLVIHDGTTWNSFDDAVTAGWISTALYGYDNGSGSYALDDSLDAFDGYWLYALTSGLTMSSYPTPSGEYTELDDFDPDMGWLLPIALEMGDVSDQVAGLGSHLNATDTFDAAYDLPVAPLPPAGTYIRAVFDHDEWDSPAGRWYAQDVRGELADDEELTYSFLIQSNDTGAFTLRFSDEDGTLPEGLPADASLTAIIDGNAYNLREQREFALNYEGSYIYVDVIVNGALDVADGTANGGLPMAYELAPARPNPFNPTTQLTLSLPATSEVTLRVYNIAGQQVATVANGQYTAGVHHLTFDGTPLASGIYFVHAQVPGELNAIRKVTLMK